MQQNPGSSGPDEGSKFQNILNFRDVGATVNQLSGTSKLKPGLIFRSARPDGATESDRSILLDKFKIKTIIDLRSKTEHIAAAKTHSDAVAIAQSAAVPATNDQVAPPLKIPGIHYAEINLNGRGFERALLWQLSWSSLARLIGLMVLGYRIEAIAILGREVMQPRGLTELGIDTLRYSGHEIKEVFELLADESNYPVLVHCTQGKDRTGIIIILVLMLCGVKPDLISEDYVISEEELEPEKEERLKDIQSIGLDESFAECPKDFVERVTDHVNTGYGEIEHYLDTIGVTTNTRAQIRISILKETE